MYKTMLPPSAYDIVEQFTERATSLLAAGQKFVVCRDLFKVFDSMRLTSFAMLTDTSTVAVWVAGSNRETFE